MERGPESDKGAQFVSLQFISLYQGKHQKIQKRASILKSHSHGPLYPVAQKLSAPVCPPRQAFALKHGRMVSLSAVARQNPPSMFSVFNDVPGLSAVVCSNGASQVGNFWPFAMVQPKHSSQSGQSRHTIPKRPVSPPCFSESNTRSAEGVSPFLTWSCCAFLVV